MTASNQPNTLFAISGASPRPAPLRRSVLVLIDAQNEYLDGALPLAGIEAAIGEAARLLRAARHAGGGVIHVVHHSAPGRPIFAPGSHGAEIIPALTPLGGEPVVVKGLPNAFAGTALAESLAAFAQEGKTGLVIGGFMTHNCVEATARAALDRGQLATVVAAATATRDLPDPLGGSAMPAGTIQRASLAALADRSALIVAKAEDLPL